MYDAWRVRSRLSEVRVSGGGSHSMACEDVARVSEVRVSGGGGSHSVEG